MSRSLSSLLPLKSAMLIEAIGGKLQEFRPKVSIHKVLTGALRLFLWFMLATAAVVLFDTYTVYGGWWYLFQLCEQNDLVTVCTHGQFNPAALVERVIVAAKVAAFAFGVIGIAALFGYLVLLAAERAYDQFMNWLAREMSIRSPQRTTPLSRQNRWDVSEYLSSELPPIKRTEPLGPERWEYFRGAGRYMPRLLRIQKARHKR